MGRQMELDSFLEQWKSREVVAYCGPIKYRGILMDVMESGFMVLSGVAVINSASRETAEYESCILNVAEVSGLAYQERVGRGGEIA